MSASYPAAVKSFAPKHDDSDAIFASHINDLQNEIMAMQTDLIKRRPSGVITVGKTGCQYMTVQQAINAASAGDTVLVYPGRYQEQVTVKAGVTVKGISRDDCEIYLAAGFIGSSYVVILNSGSRLYDIKVTGPLPGGGSTWTAVSCASADVVGAVVSGCHVGPAQYGISMGGTNGIVTNNIIATPNSEISGFYHLVSNNTFIYDGPVTECFSPVDMTGAGRCLVSSNTARMKSAMLGENGSYFISLCSRGGNIIANNTIYLESDRSYLEAVMIYPDYITVPDPSLSEPTYFVNNHVTLVSTNQDAIAVCGVWANYYSNQDQANTHMGNIVMEGNTIVPIYSGQAVYVPIWSWWYEGAAPSYGGMVGETGSIKTDERSVAGAEIVNRGPLHITISRPVVGKNIRRQYLKDVVPASSTSIWATPIALSSVAVTMLVDGSTDPIPLAHLRCLQIAGSTGASGTVTIYGWGLDGTFQKETFTISGVGPYVSNMPFSRVWFADVASAGSGTFTVGFANKFGVDRLGIFEILGVSKNWATPAAPQAYDANYGTVSITSVSNGDDFEFIFQEGY